MRPVSPSVTIPGRLRYAVVASLFETRLLSGWSQQFLAACLIGIWLMVVIGIPAYLSIQLASWLTFIGLLIAPGYLLADIITGRLELDWLERLALALPFGVAILAVPGTMALLLHLTITELTAGWVITTTLVLVAWLLYIAWPTLLSARYGSGLRWRAEQARNSPWATDELIMLLLLAAAFVFILPSLTLHKIDGDAYAVNSFVADALAGLPLNASEPLFGTNLGPGVRMVFNQTLPMFYLWSHLADIDPITLTATASRSMIALWAILAAYTLGKAAGAGNRRLGLFTASILLLIYMAAPFVRGDNISIFFFERINADKFMVPVTMLPVVLAFSIRFIRAGRLDVWLAAAVATFAVSTIHPLVAAMLALALTAFGGFHLVLNVRRWISWKRTFALGGLVVIVMFLPLVQLVVARGEAPLAPSYPDSFEGWPVGQKMVPVVPFVYLPSLDYYGPLPDLAQLEASQADTTTNPFLIWRFAVNMNRRRLILFNLDQYISDPNIILEPPYLLALLLLPLLLWKIRSNVGAQAAVGITLAVLFVMFNPILTPLIGSLVMPWILWRFIWLLPFALIIALALQRLLVGGLTILTRWVKSDWAANRVSGAYVLLGFIVVAGLVSSPLVVRNIQNLKDRVVAPVFFPTPRHLLTRLNDLTAGGGPVTVLADQDLSVTIPAYVANANVVAHRIPTTSEVFPADQQNVALQRLIDQYTFFHTPYLTANSVDILQRYNVQYVVVASGSSLDMQLRLAPQWFEWLMDDQSFSLYGLHQLPTTTASILGNSVLVQRQWSEAEQYYQAALQQSSGDLLALTGLAEIARAQGQYDVAVTKLQQAKSQIDVPILHYRLGQLYAESGQVDQSAIEFDLAQRVAQGVSRFHVALGDACLNLGQVVCTTAQYQGAVATENLPDEASRYIAQADLWRQQGRTGHALSLYEQAVDLNSSEYYQFVLESVYREVGQFERAEQVVQALRVKHPFSVEVVSATANVMAAQNRHDEAIRLYRYAIWLQNIQAQETVDTRLALTQVLLAADLLAEAQAEIEVVLALHPHNALAYRLMGDLYSQQQEFEQATAAYWQAFQLDPGQVAVYVALSNQLRLQGGRSEEALQLLETTIRFNPDEASLFLALGDQWQRSGDGTAAINAYLSALDRLDAYSLSSPLRRQPAVQSRAYAYARLARLYEDLGQLEPAMNYYRSAAVAAPNLPWPHVVLGDALRRRNDSAGAEAAYHQAIQVDNTHVNAYVRLAELHYNRGDITQSNELYDLAEQLALIDAGQAQKATTGLDSHSQAHPPDPALESDETLVAPDYRLADQATLNASAIARQLLEADEEVNTVFELARLYQARDQTNQAIQLYQEKLRQGQVENWSKAVLARYRKNLGDLYLSQRQYEQAVNEYQQAVILDSWWPEARLSLAEALFQQGDPVNALQHIQVAASNAPGSIVAQVALANILDQWGDRDRALKIYQNIAQTYPGNVRATLALAQAWRDRDHSQQAEESYRDSIALNPGMIEAYIGLAELFIDQDRYEEAKTLLEQALEIESQNITAYVRLGELEQRRGNPEQALTWYKEAAVVAETGQTIDMTLIDSLLWYGDYDRAMAYVQRSLDRQPGDSELLLRLSRIHRALGRDDDAAFTLFEAKRLHSANSRLTAELAELHLDRGDPQTALDFYQQAIGLEPAEIVYYIAASQIMATQGRYAEALALLEDGQSRVVGPTALYTTMSTLYTQQGETDLALSILERALRDIGENEQLLLAMGSYFVSRGNFDQVELRYNQALELQPDAAAVHAALADLYLRQNLYDQALEHYQQAVALVPGNPGFYLSLGNAYRQAERTDEAITTYARAVATAPTLVEAYVNLAALYQEQAGWDEAQAVYEQGLVVIPTSGRLLTQYSAFLIERGDEAQALVLLDQAGQVAPTAATLIARATLYGELGRVDDAQRDLQTALQKEPGSIDALLALGDLARAQEDIEAAKQWYQQAVSQRPGVPAGYLRLGSLAAEERDRDAALEYSRAAREAEPGGLLRPDDQ